MLARVRLLAVILLSFISVLARSQSAPVISNLSPSVGPVSPVGGPVTIKGSGFGTSQGGSVVTFAGVAASPSSWSDTRIVAPVPNSLPAGSADVVVTVSGAPMLFLLLLLHPMVPEQSAETEGSKSDQAAEAVRGTVIDPTGAVVSNFNVEVRKAASDSNTSFGPPMLTLQTSHEGEFLVDLPPVTYKICVRWFPKSCRIITVDQSTAEHIVLKIDPSDDQASAKVLDERILAIAGRGGPTADELP
ncbi:MAG TPA: IPT/TIG domain-containing protein [Candidatus Angelobacter sp.]|nr:IPT/TIG domain-containing protein [Candidatus Angelobacter sp.]